LVLFKRFLREDFVRANKITSSSNRPPQHFYHTVITIFLVFINMSLINILNKIGNMGYHWRTPQYIGNSSENLPLKLTIKAFEVRY